MNLRHNTPLMAIILLLGCMPTAKVDSNIRAGYKKTIQSIYIISSVTKTGSPEFTNDLLRNLEAKFAGVSIKSKSRVRNPLSLDESSEIKSDMETLRPSTIMYIVQTSKTQRSGSGGSFGGAIFEISMHEAGEETPFWKAVVETQTPNASWSSSFGGFGSDKKVGDPQLTANSIFAKLQSDGLIQMSPGK
jgi:hypothetical protein